MRDNYGVLIEYDFNRRNQFGTARVVNFGVGFVSFQSTKFNQAENCYVEPKRFVRLNIEWLCFLPFTIDSLIFSANGILGSGSPQAFEMTFHLFGLLSKWL